MHACVMLPESAEGRLRQAPPRRVPGMDMHAYGPASAAQTPLAPTTTGLSVSQFTVDLLRAPPY